MNPADIVIVGGGSAGLAAAASLLKRDGQLRITLIEPSDTHYYQPAWTLVGGGQFDLKATARSMQSVLAALPGKGVEWVQARAVGFSPDTKQVRLDNGQVLTYQYLVLAPGLQCNWGGIEGLQETLGKNGVTSNYHYEYAPYTFELVKKLQSQGGGKAIFTQAPMPIKCPGAPQKAMYLACSNWERAGALKNMEVDFFNAGAALFGVAHYVPSLMEYVKRYGINLNFNATLYKIDGSAKKAWFKVKDADGNVTEVERDFDLLHVTPPQSALDSMKGSPVCNADGFVEVDQATLQHIKYPEIFGVGDATTTPNSKTAAAARKQVVVMAQNLLAHRASQAMPAQYDGYGSCPLTVEIGKIVLAEFGYGGKLMPTFPLEGAVPRWSSWVLKKNLLPWVYWNAMLKGREWLTGPE